MRFNESQLVTTLNELPIRKRVAFAAACCERVLPNYEAFVLAEKLATPSGRADMALLNCSLDVVWRFVKSGTLSTKQVSHLMSQCEAVIPDSDEFSSIFTGAAANAAASVIYTLQSCLDGDSNRIALVGRLVIDSLDEYLYIVNAPHTGYEAHDPLFDHWIQQAPLIRAELDRQQHDLDVLKTQSKLDSYLLHHKQSLIHQVGLFPIERGLVVACVR